MKQKAKEIILIIATFFILFNIVAPTASYAGELSWAGVIFDPITFLMAGIADAANNTLQRLMLPGSPKAVMNRERRGRIRVRPSNSI